MKSIILKSLALSLIALSLWSCKKDGTISTATDGTGGTLKSSATAVALDKSMLTTNVVTLTFTNADFGYQAAITNTLQISKKGSNFAADKTKEVTLEAKSLSISYNGLDFNNLLLSLNLPTTVNSDVELRIKSSISANVAPTYSNVISISAKPFPLTSWVYVPGNYQGWNPATADSLVSITGNGVYVGIINFDGNNFKITPAKKWDIAYGTTGGGKLSTSGGDISSVSAGLKLLTVDLNANVYTIEPAKVWAIIGNATPGDWSADTDMKFINDGNGVWKLTTNLTVGEMKFRQDHDWGVNLGGSGGNLSSGGANIVISTAGNYTITLNTTTNKYTLVKN
ncbi:SusE domain-containing protein [Pedobacter sp. Du54]|uniref:SusE domain-containing protein n=1 Tax=Pedobacter anseongensis TaxID=3133439 RepID=UPI00309CEED1